MNNGTYNHPGKTIVSTDNWSPAFELRRLLRVTELDDQQKQRLPQLQYWSDLVWISWTSIAHHSNEVAGLKYIFRTDVITPNTVFIIEGVLGLQQGDFPDDGGRWPGTKFTPEEEAFFALLGTVHGMYVKFPYYQLTCAMSVITSTLPRS